MPPKRKKLGRPPGSKNKKPSVKDLANKLAKIKRNNIEESVRTPTDYQCTVCDKYFPSKKALLKHKALEVSKVIYTKVSCGAYISLTYAYSVYSNYFKRFFSTLL